MQKVGIAGFTVRGKELAGQIVEKLQGQYEFLCYEKNLSDWCARCFAEAEKIIFVGACGIAVRTIAPFIRSKAEDPAVLDIDEAGQFVISLLSGHIGGANEFAIEVAEVIGATPVITTASDVNGKIAIDVFARKNNLKIASLTDAKKIAAAIVRGDRVEVFCSGQIEGTMPPELTWPDTDQNADYLVWISEQLPLEALREKKTVLHLIPQCVSLGIGCRRGKPEAAIEETVSEVLHSNGISPDALCGAASIDLKKEEAGILGMCQKRGLTFETYTAEELMQVPGEFASSAFVQNTTGADNVCERSALRLAGEQGRLIQKKYIKNGVTAALAVRKWRIRFEK